MVPYPHTNENEKTFNEAYEQSVWQMVLEHVDQEKRIDGKLAYVIRDMSELVVGIMEFYEQEKNTRSE